VILLVWEFVPAIFNVSKLRCRAPSSIARSLWLIYDRGLLIENFLVTLAEALLGFAIGSVTAIFLCFRCDAFADHRANVNAYLVAFRRFKSRLRAH